jgi:outer membrane receptor protein involved in Fe transport
MKNFSLLMMMAYSMLAVCAVKAQNTPYSVSGTAIDKSDNSPVASATVTLHLAADSSSAAYTLTGDDGVFSIACKDAGVYYLQIHYLGYKTFVSNVFSLSNENSHIAAGNIFLEELAQELSEVQVVGQRRQVIYKPGKQVLNASGFISAAGGTALDILAQTPSVRIDADGSVSFRGSTGFKVYVDGKPASQDLEQIPTGLIESIEVITTPSAKDNADGSAGIINIMTKQQSADGWSGMINVMGSSLSSRNIDFLTSLRKNGYRWQLSGEASRRYVLSDFDQLKTITAPDTVTTSHSTGVRERHVDTYFLRSAWDWYRENTTWSAATQVGYRDRWRGGELYYEDTYKPVAGGAMRYDTLNGKDFVHLYEWSVREDVGMEHRFPDREGHLLTASLYALYEGNAMENFQTDLWDMRGRQAQGHRAWEYEYRLTAQANADYIHPFADNSGKFESGYQLYTYTEDGDYKVDMYNPAIGAFERRDDLYNKYLFRRDIHALYLMVSHNYNRFGWQAGLRGEYSYWKLGNNREWARHTRNRFDLFPSVHLTYQLAENDRLTMAYSRRITQPELFYMEPYVVYVDYYTAQCGNPFIRPEYTNAVEASYHKIMGNSTLTATVFHRARTDKIERVRIPYHTGITLDSMTNVGDDYATGVELAATIPLTKWWNFDANGSLYDYRIKNDFKVAGKDEQSRNWQLAVNNNFDVARNTRMRLESYYVGPSVSTQGRVNEFFYLNFTVRQQLFDRKLTATLIVSDVLSSAKYVSSRSSAGMETLTKIYPRSPLFTATLSYTFNNFRQQKKAETVSHDLFEGTNR